jgi:hypothetical protein
MSYTEVGSITALSGGVINVPSGHVIQGQAGSIRTSGSVIQTAFKRNDYRATYYSYVQGNDQNRYTPIRHMNLNFRPMYANSMVLVKFVLNFEMTYNSVWSLLKDEQPFITTTGEAYPRRWGSMAVTPYDRGDNSSTPQKVTLMWMDIPGTTDMITYGVGFRSGGAGDPTCYFNRTASSTGTDSYEVGVSTGLAWEIAQ